MLYEVNRQIPKETYKDIDNRPKNLLHMTEEDLQPKSPAVLREELNELIKEAKTKIKPVRMSDEDREKYIKPLEDANENKDLLDIDFCGGAGHLLLDTEKISLEILRKIQDKKFEVDIKYEQTRDLYAKQRVVDQYLEEHQEDNKQLNSYYENRYVQSKMNKYLKFIYNNSYSLSEVRLNLFASTLSTAFTTGALFLVNPYLAIMSLYDWYLLAAFSSQIVNRTVHQMVLHQNKYHLIVNKLNFLGFETERQELIQIREILYVGEVKNEYLSFDYTGLPPSISKIISLSNTQLEKDAKGDVMSDSVKDQDKNTYKHFLAFMAKDNRYLIPVDGNNFKESVIAEELLNHIVHGRQRSVLSFDYSSLEAEGERLDNNF